ncbi:Surfeit locus protein 1-like protein [Sarcoptes scabiei]|nr:Surfeit locus protein 1-like protein [Sarcoptes scabiei]
MKILRQKLPTIEEIDRLPIEELPQDSKDIQRLIHRKVKLRGKFQHSDEQLISNCTDLDLTRTFFLRRGLYVMTPFVLDDGRRIMVNRGWIPYKLQDPKERIFGQISDHIELNAYVVIPEAKKFSLLDFLFYSVLNRLDYGKIIEDSQIDIDAIFVADKASTTMMGPRGGQLQLFDDFYYIDRYKYSIIL